MRTEPVPGQILSLERPHRALWTYYVIRSILTGPALFFTLPYLFFRYHTLRYRFDAEGIHMRVGLLFRREVNLTYARIQDIHLRSGIIQRWLGLANLQIQTASGSAGPEMLVEGFKEFEAIRDFLYTRMRGYQAHTNPSHPTTTPSVGASASAAGVGAAASDQPEMISLLLGIRNELRGAREMIESGRIASAPPQPPPHV
jgi:membrane protein YdbS with pleckstrin-like domain